MSTRKIRTSLISLAVILVAPLNLTGQPAQAAADGCEPGFSTDFNGDDHSDTVVADPYATVGTIAEAGRVIVLYGDADNRIGEGTRATLFQGAPGVGNAAEAGDRFGFALAVADIDCDEYADLMVGSPYENVGSAADAGLVQIIWGGPGGLGIRATLRADRHCRMGRGVGGRKPLRIRRRCIGGRRSRGDIGAVRPRDRHWRTRSRCRFR